MGGNGSFTSGRHTVGKVVTLTCHPGGTQCVPLVGPCSSKADIFVKRVGVKRGFPGGASGKEPDRRCRRLKRRGSIPGSGRSPGGGPGIPCPPVFLPGGSHGQRGLEGYTRGGKESDTTEATEHTGAKKRRM